MSDSENQLGGRENNSYFLVHRVFIIYFKELLTSTYSFKPKIFLRNNPSITPNTLKGFNSKNVKNRLQELKAIHGKNFLENEDTIQWISKSGSFIALKDIPDWINRKYSDGDPYRCRSTTANKRKLSSLIFDDLTSEEKTMAMDAMKLLTDAASSHQEEEKFYQDEENEHFNDSFPSFDEVNNNEFSVQEDEFSLQEAAVKVNSNDVEETTASSLTQTGNNFSLPLLGTLRTTIFHAAKTLVKDFSTSIGLTQSSSQDREIPLGADIPVVDHSSTEDVILSNKSSWRESSNSIGLMQSSSQDSEISRGAEIPPVDLTSRTEDVFVSNKWSWRESNR
jgi:hypothetical protein